MGEAPGEVEAVQRVRVHARRASVGTSAWTGSPSSTAGTRTKSADAGVLHEAAASVERDAALDVAPQPAPRRPPSSQRAQAATTSPATMPGSTSALGGGESVGSQGAGDDVHRAGTGRAGR